MPTPFSIPRLPVFAAALICLVGFAMASGGSAEASRSREASNVHRGGDRPQWCAKRSSARHSRLQGRRHRRPRHCAKAHRSIADHSQPAAAAPTPAPSVESALVVQRQETAPAEPGGASEAPVTAPPAETPAETPVTDPPSVVSAIVPSSAVAEYFGTQPADVLLDYPAAIATAEASGCAGFDAAGAPVPFGGIDPGPEADTVRLQLAPGEAMPEKVECATSSGTVALPVAVTPPTEGGLLSDPIDPKYLTQVPFGSSSFWIQPWRSYLDTWPASRLLNSLGINFNVTPKEAPGVAQLLGDSGFKLARVEIGWGTISYDDPNSFVDESSIRRRLEALREHHLRPLILLNANSTGPAPSAQMELETVSPAAAGSRTVKLSAASAAAVVPGRTGFDQLAFGGNPDVLVTSVSSNRVAQLSMPLPAALPAGLHRGTTLRYGPFAPPTLASGTPNPEFQATLAGWLSYVQTVCDEAESIFGADGYDLELWNELSFGSEFLREEKYYSPPRDSGGGSIKEVKEVLRAETVAYVRDPAHGISPKVGISDGFASQTPFASGAKDPVGVTALSKHLYKNPLRIPRDYQPLPGIKPIDALGGLDSIEGGSGAKHGSPKAPTVPEYTLAMPEYFLTATQTETLVRDLAPTTTTVNGVPHGRFVGPAGGSPSQVWMTEYGLNPYLLLPVSAEDPGKPQEGEVSAAEAVALQTRVILRSLVSMVAKGVGREYFYAAAHSKGHSLVGEAFMSAINQAPTQFPGDLMGGETMASLKRLLTQFQGPGPDGQARQLRLLTIAQENDRAEFSGDGTAAHPSLFDRDLLAVFPFQSSPSRFVIPAYVMTPNLTTVYGSGSAATGFADENFRITLGNLPETVGPPAVSAYDPILDQATPARLVSRLGDEAVFEFAATNYPRLLTIDFAG
jgi:hypothetical protein